MSELEVGASSAEPEVEEKPSSFRRAGFIITTIVLFFFFLLMKLPEARIQNLVTAHIKIALQQQGYSFSAERITTGIFLGPCLKFYNITLQRFDNDKQFLKIPYLRVGPKLLSLLPFVNVKKFKISAELLDGSVSGWVGTGATITALDLDVSTLHLNKASFLQKYLPLEVSDGILSASVDLNVDTTQMQKTEGHVRMTLKKIELPSQTLYGFNVPKISLNDSHVDLNLGEGKVTIRDFYVGKDIKADSLVAHVTGDGTIEAGRAGYSPLEKIRLNTKVVFQIAPSLMQSFPLLDTILQSAKTSDGRYAYRVSGPLLSPQTVPGAGN